MIKHLLITCAILLALCSCKTVGVSTRPSLDSIVPRLELKKTTRDEVRNWLGDPNRTKKNGPLDVWTYEEVRHEQRTALAEGKIGSGKHFDSPHGYVQTITYRTTMTLVFNPDGTLRNFQVLRPD
jgi:outer membrane protein assembly factor BamE (lipoprotein component of BamABCDE complex)